MNLITVKTFNLFPEYFLGVSVLYMLIVTVLISYNVLGLIIQQPISNCIGLILFFACYLIINDDQMLNLDRDLLQNISHRPYNFLFMNILDCHNDYKKIPEHFLVIEPSRLSINCLFDYFDFDLITESSKFPIETYILGFYGSVLTDDFGVFAKLILCFFSAVYFLIISDFLKDYKLTSFEYLLILLFAIIGLLLLATSNDLLSAYLAIELISLSSYLLAAFKKNSSYSIEAGIKYLIIGSISSAFFLLGSSFIYAALGTLLINEIQFLFDSNAGQSVQIFCGVKYLLSTLNDLGCYTIIKEEAAIWKNLREVADGSFNPELDWREIIFHNLPISYFTMFFSAQKDLIPLIEIGIVFIIFSCFIKLALAPFYVWSLHVYEGSPSISTFFFSVITKLSIFIFLIRICIAVSNDPVPDIKKCWQFYFIIVGFLSVFVGSFGGLRQKRLKTLLAYSSTSHMGYILLSLSTNLDSGIEMFLFYLITYMISGIIIWFIILLVRENKKFYANKLNKELGDFVLLKKSNPALAISLSVAMFSIAGIPPFIGFFAKLGIFLSLLHSEYYMVTFLTILCSVVSTFYYIRIIKILYFENVLIGKLNYSIKTDKIIILTMFVFILFFLFINPTLFYLYIHWVTQKSFFCL